MSEVLVIGHRNPDTDAICSAIGYAEFKRRTGMPDAVAARCGDTNDRIDYVLDKFKVPAPKFVADVSPRTRDVMQSNVVFVNPGATVAEAVGIMDERNIRVLPMLDDHRACIGLVSVFKMSRYFFPSPNRLFDSRRVLASLNNLARTLSGTIVNGPRPDDEEDLVLMIGAMGLESFSKRLTNYSRERILVVVGDRRDIQEQAIKEGVRAVVVTGGLPIDPAIVKLAKDKGVALLSSPHDSVTTASLCRAAITVKHVVHETFLTFDEGESLSSAQHRASDSAFHAFPVLDKQKRTIGIVTKSDLLKKVDRKLILVDHNEMTQAVQGADKVEILEIIDHHRIGAITTSQPILFRNEPVGSTSTIVADCFFRYQVEMPQTVAGLLLAGLVADTLNLTSPTTTPRDAQVLKQLESISGINAKRFTEKLFASGSVLTSKPAPKAITTDCKEYEEQGQKFSVAQIEEIGFETFWKRKDEVMKALEAYRVSKGCFFSALMVTDVVLQSSLLLVTGSESFIQNITYHQTEPGIFDMPGVVSRKKQLLPYLTHCLENVA
ncbi:MAG: putative manganese-dependent inorganic diphosphatase [Verrucomicrobiota bacterium]